MQYVDARDLANFAVRVAEESLRGAYHVAAPESPTSFRQVLETVAAHVAPLHTTLHEVTVGRAERLGGKFPLWSPQSENVLALDSTLAVSKGLNLRPLEDSVDDVLEWWGDRAWPEQWLTPEEEARLLAA
jgi:2'-hydroxyisoflavone reductase